MWLGRTMWLRMYFCLMLMPSQRLYAALCLVACTTLMPVSSAEPNPTPYPLALTSPMSHARDSFSADIRRYRESAHLYMRIYNGFQSRQERLCRSQTSDAGYSPDCRASRLFFCRPSGTRSNNRIPLPRLLLALAKSKRRSLYKDV